MNKIIIFVICSSLIFLKARAESEELDPSSGTSDVYQLEDIIVRAEKEDAEKRFSLHITDGYHGMPADTTQPL